MANTTITEHGNKMEGAVLPMPDNERRSDEVLRLLIDEVKEANANSKKCIEQHQSIGAAMAEIGATLKMTRGDVARIGEKVDKNAEEAAGVRADVRTLKNQNKDQYDQLRAIQQGEKTPFWTHKNFVYAIVGVVVVVAIAYGVITADNVTELKGVGK